MTTTNKAFIDLVADRSGPSSTLGEIVKPPPSQNPARFIIIGAGERGKIYATAVAKATNGIIAAVAEPSKFKRESMGKELIWGQHGHPTEGQSFQDWKEFLTYELSRRRREEAGEKDVPIGVDGVFICVQDAMHREVLVGLGPLGLHIMCEKPLSTSLESCLAIYKALKPSTTTKIFSIGHVLRYSPHNKTLRKLLVEDKVIGAINSVVHTEPVGWWHFTHSYVRGNWRNSDWSGPSLLTKCCHDIDLLAWILASPEKAGQGATHFPSTISSSGGLQTFKKSRKPKAAGSATNCFKCPLGDSGCKYSSKNIYNSNRYQGLETGNKEWPISVVVPDIEDHAPGAAQAAVLQAKLEEDYDESTPAAEVRSRNWFGRCVFEADNNVCDDQFVTMTWPETEDQPAKQATLHMVSHTQKQCHRYSHFYGDQGEIYADSTQIAVTDFESGEVKTLYPVIEDPGHGGGDVGLARQFVTAVDKVKNEGWEAPKAQNEVMQVTLEEAVRSHAFVFAAEEARTGGKVLDWSRWWDDVLKEHNIPNGF